MHDFFSLKRSWNLGRFTGSLNHWVSTFFQAHNMRLVIFSPLDDPIKIIFGGIVLRESGELSTGIELFVVKRKKVSRLIKLLFGRVRMMNICCNAIFWFISIIHWAIPIILFQYYSYYEFKCHNNFNISLIHTSPLAERQQNRR